MKVLLIHDKDLASGAHTNGAGVCSHEAGGLAVYLTSLVREFERAGTRVVTLDLRSDGTAAEPRADGAGHYKLPGFRFRYRSSVRRALERIVTHEEPDVVHLHSVTSIHPRLVRSLLRLRPLVWSFHDASSVCMRLTLLDAHGAPCDRPVGYGCVTCGCYRLGSLERLPTDALRVASHPLRLRTLRAAPVLLVPSSYLRDVLICNGFSPDKVRVVPLFSRFEGGPSARPPGSVPRILFAGRLSREKGALKLLDALGRMREEPWWATIAGDGPQRGAATERARSLGLEERVHFPGELSPAALQREYADCDVVALPSLAPESFGLVGVEAMACARPVVAFDAGGVREWLVEGETGLLARHGDDAHLAQQLGVLLQDAELRRRMGTAARERQRERYTGPIHVAELRAIYRAAAAVERRAV